MENSNFLKKLENFEEHYFHELFSADTKMLNKVPKEFVERYRTLFLFLLESLKKGELPYHHNYLGDSELAKNIYINKYFLKGKDNKLLEETPEELFVRVASFIAAVEEDEEKAKQYAREFYRIMYDGKFIPGGRVLAGAGDLFRLKTLANCFVSMIEDDNIESIYKANYEAARTYSYGGGIGIDISILRPKGSVVHNASTQSTGAVSFMELYSLTTGIIGQEGRRGALMITIHSKHPDVLDFMRVKRDPNWVTNQILQQLKWSGKFSEAQLNEIKKTVMENTQVRFANISVKLTDELFNAVNEEISYGRDKILVYKKKKKGKILEFYHEEMHYSIDMPSKNLEDYELLQVFNSIEELNSYLKEYGKELTKQDLEDAYKRDIFSDYVLELPDKDFDLAIRYAGDFLLYYFGKDTNSVKKLVKAREIWNEFVEGNYKTAEPGGIFWNIMKKYSPSDYVNRPIVSTNPCAEVPLEDGGACNLGSINLSRFVKNPYSSNPEIDFEELERVTSIAIRFLDNVITWNIFLNPLEKQREAAKLTRRVGLGVMGIADMLNMLNLAYDSDEGISIIDRVMDRIKEVAYQTSAKLANEKGAAKAFNYESYSKGAFFRENLSEETKELIKRYGLRNIALLSIAPTGSISNIVKSFEFNGKNYFGVSGGIEPVFALYYTRRSESFGNKLFKVFHSTVQAYIDMHNLNDKVQDAKDIESLKKILPPFFFRTAHEIDPFKRIEVQAICQKHVDHSISSTINLPEDIEPEIMSNLYLYGWKKGLKGLTIYRDGSRYPILSVEGKRTEFQEIKEKVFLVKERDKEYIVNGDHVVELPNGELTTIYHLIKKKTVELKRKHVGEKDYGLLTTNTYEKIRIKDLSNFELFLIEKGHEDFSKKAVIKIILEKDNKEGKEQKTLSEIEVANENFAVCPVCGQNTLKLEVGCATCLNPDCGYSKCDK